MALFKSIRTGVLDKKTAARLQERCLSDYQDATNYEETGVAEITRSKLANRARINIDQTFVDAARRTEAYEDERLKCLKARESDSHLSEPRHDGPYKIVKTGDNSIFTYFRTNTLKKYLKSAALIRETRCRKRRPC